MSRTFEVASFDITGKVIGKDVIIGEFDTKVYDGICRNPHATVTVMLEDESVEVPGIWSPVRNVNDTTTFDADFWNRGGNFVGEISNVSTGTLPKPVTAVVTVEDKYGMVPSQRM